MHNYKHSETCESTCYCPDNCAHIHMHQQRYVALSTRYATILARRKAADTYTVDRWRNGTPRFEVPVVWYDDT